MSSASIVAGTQSRLVSQPSARRLRALAASAACVRRTRYGSLNIATRVTSRCRTGTVWVCDTGFRLPGPTMSRMDGERLARLQEARLAEVGAVVVDGYLGAADPLRLPVRLVVEAPAASLAAMQRHLLFDPVVGDPAFTPELTAVVTPGLTASGTSDGVQVAVWLDEGVTRVVGSDFFGETKKALTRMWSERVYDLGGIVLHAACLLVPTAHGPVTAVVSGPPDSGKSTLAMRGVTGGQLVQDDFVALLPGGRIVPAENGCIEKTWRLDPLRQPVLHAAVTRPDAYLENVAQRGMDLDLADERAPRHARAVFPLHAVGGRADAALGPLSLMLLLEPSDDLAPALVRLPAERAPGYFLLRERGDALAEPSGRLGNRLAALLAGSPAQVAVLNTAVACQDGAGDVRGTAAAGVLAALAEDSIEWDTDPSDGTVAHALPALIDPDRLWPRHRYASLGLLADYEARLAARRAERFAYLSRFAGLDPAIVAALN